MRGANQKKTGINQIKWHDEMEASDISIWYKSNLMTKASKYK